MIRIFKYGEVDNSEIFARTEMPANVEKTVSDIISEVRNGGDIALVRYGMQFDGLMPPPDAGKDGTFRDVLEVSREEIDEAYDTLDPELRDVLEEAAANIRDFHSRQVREGFKIEEKEGIILGQKVTPIAKAGIYVPGGTAAYPSTVLMDTIPAKIAGVSEVVMTSPATGGSISKAILAAARIAGVDRIFRVGGAQAIAALAYGTETVPRVDKIVGPGNAFVAEAKKQVFGQVGIDMIAGPSEILIVADKTCDGKIVAADMLSQAEHDKFATAVLVTDSMFLANQVREEIEFQLKALPREEIARASIQNNGKIIVAENIELAIDIANEIAPEHFELCVDDPFRYLDRIKNAGSIFLGKSCPEALGDYFAGPNHTLPTSGTARFYSPLSVDDFTKRMQFSWYSEDAISEAAPKIARFAEEEGLIGHARSVMLRKK